MLKISRMYLWSVSKYCLGLKFMNLGQNKIIDWWYLICLEILFKKIIFARKISSFIGFMIYLKLFYKSKNLRGWSEGHQCLICPEHGGLKNWIIQSIRILKTCLHNLQVQIIYFFFKSFNQKLFFEITNHKIQNILWT